LEQWSVLVARLRETSKSQHPSAREYSIPKLQLACHKDWILKVEISMDVGAWNLDFQTNEFADAD
jgi:hypothetical protein